jgi:hypothetical protein
MTEKEKRRTEAYQKVQSSIRDLKEVMKHIPTAEDSQLIEEMGTIFRLIGKCDLKESDMARLQDLADQHGLPVEQLGDTYRIDGFAADGLPQALAYAEGIDRASCGEPALFLGAEVERSDRKAAVHRRDASLLKQLIEQNGIIIADNRYAAYETSAFKAFTLSEAIGFAQGVAQYQSTSRSARPQSKENGGLIHSRCTPHPRPGKHR